jgi:putative membrane protein
VTTPASVPGIPPPPSAPEGQRLHPWSWLFVLIQQLRQFLVPLLVLVFAGRRNTEESDWTSWAPLVGMAVLVAYSVLEYFTYRYRIGSTGIQVRSGLLQRNQREIPFTRIHNVALHQNLLHRLFKVAEVRLEAAGGSKPEAQMRVLGLEQALALEQLVRHHGEASPPATGGDGDAVPTAAAPERLLALGTAEVVRLGLVSNRGMLVVAAGAGVLFQAFPEKAAAGIIQRFFRDAMDYAGELQLGWLSLGAAGLAMLGLALALLRLLSVGLALSQFHGFSLVRTQGRLLVERGLFARIRSSVSPRRIQAWYLEETLLHRWFGRRSLRIDTATGGAENDPRKLRDLAPIATPGACDALLGQLLPGQPWPPARWNRLPASAGWRLFAGDLPWLALATAVLAWQLGAWALLALGWLPLSAYASWRQARRLGYALDRRMVAVRGGWWSRWWRFAEIDKLQALRLQRSPLDRCLGTASVWLDTAGAGAFSPPLRIRFLPLAEASALMDELGRMLAHRRQVW